MKDSKNLQKVTLDDFNIAALRQAAREGRLFIQPAQVSEQQERQQGIADIMRYVARIDDCVSSKYRSHIHDVWAQILHDQMLQSLFFMEKGVRKNKPNWYRVTSVVSIMREWNIYRQSDFTSLDLHLLMEGISKHNSILTSSTHYYPNHKELLQIKRILSNMGL